MPAFGARFSRMPYCWKCLNGSTPAAATSGLFARYHAASKSDADAIGPHMKKAGVSEPAKVSDGWEVLGADGPDGHGDVRAGLGERACGEEQGSTRDHGLHGAAGRGEREDAACHAP